MLEGRADVIVCEGFVGNVLLKACESFHTLIQSVLDRRTAEAAHDQLAVLNPDNYGAVPLLGIDGMVFKAHGAASSTAITNAVLTAITAVEKSACGEERTRPTERHKRQ